jgi:hypothetical protein
MNNEQTMDLVRKVGLFGLKDLNKLAPIGDLDYLNAISYYRGDFLRSGLIEAIMDAFREQMKDNGWTVQGGDTKWTKWRCTDHWSYCPELGLRWSVDSSD